MYLPNVKPEVCCLFCHLVMPPSESWIQQNCSSVNWVATKLSCSELPCTPGPLRPSQEDRNKGVNCFLERRLPRILIQRNAVNFANEFQSLKTKLALLQEHEGKLLNVFFGKGRGNEQAYLI